jgi:hypothetical protein
MYLCVLGFQLVNHQTFIERLIDIVFGFAGIIQLFIYSFGGQIIMDSSASVAEDFYDIEKDFVVMIARAHKTFSRVKFPVFG